nr:DEAD/DEAH box helicase [Pseudomonas sp. GX19020]
MDAKQPPTVTRLQELGVSYLAVKEEAVAPAPPATADLAELCRRIFGHDEFRPGQEALILNAISGQKSLGLMPTGGGKSLCFQVPALLKSGTTITVVPIKALGRDHCAELEAAGFTGRVVNIDSDMPAQLRDRVRSASQAVAEAAKETVYEANSDILAAVVWTATLDSRNTLMCDARDGKRY